MPQHEVEKLVSVLSIFLLMTVTSIEANIPIPKS